MGNCCQGKDQPQTNSSMLLQPFIDDNPYKLKLDRAVNRNKEKMTDIELMVLKSKLYTGTNDAVSEISITSI